VAAHCQFSGVIFFQKKKYNNQNKNNIRQHGSGHAIVSLKTGTKKENACHVTCGETADFPATTVSV